MFTRNFTQLNKNDTNIAGGKGASLGEMIQAGIPVPPGFVVLAGTFEKFLAETDLGVEVDAILETVDHNAMHTVEHASEKIQALIKKAQMPKNIAEEIEKEFVKLDAEFVAVRSSATAEDGAENAWAGQLDSYLNTTQDNLLEKVQNCWASLFTPRAIFYRFEKGLHTQKISVAVAVQKMVASEISGIAFSVHPVTEDYNQLIIEAGFGLGEAIVSGSITPDSYVVGKEPRSILDINVATQTRGLYRAQNGGNHWQDIPEPQASSQVLTSEQILELSEIILGIEKHYGFPCDIEWAYEAGKFYIVQSRPITTLQKKQEVPEENIVEFIDKHKFHKQFVYSFLPVASKTFLPLFTFEATTYCYVENPLLEKLGINKLPRFIITLKDGYEDWEDGNMQKITKNEDIEFIMQECRAIMQKHLQFTEELLQKDYSKVNNIELAEILRESNEVMKEVCRRQIFLIRDFFETKNPNYIKLLPELRVEITEFVDKFYISCNDILTALADRFEQIPWRTFMYATTDEIIELLQESKTIDEFAKINNRHCAFVFDGKKISFVTDISIVAKIDEALKKQEVENADAISSRQYETIHGNSAFGGHAKGIVVKITDAQYRNIAKYLENKKDYILVISMTRPEFMPYLKNCKAIITDEGGITCHAAIVSRELKIPCIIGTKIATQVLQDGDLVEVDANEGIVKIIKNTPQEYRQIFNRTIDVSGCELWDLGERVELPKICESAIYFDPLFYYRAGKGVSVFYNFSDPKQQLTPLVEYFNQNKERLFELKKPFDDDCQKVQKILKNRNVGDADRLFDLIVKTWPLIVSSNILGDDSRENVFGVDENLVNEYINIRKESDGVSHLGEVLIVEFIRNIIPIEYKKWAEFLKYDEVVSGRLPEIAELQKREVCYIYHKGKIYSGLALEEYAKQNNFRIVTHKDRIDMTEIKNEITGQSAHKGVQQGIVKVVFEKKDIAKVEKGDIMVTPMTTPDLIVAMQMASAFVTDEGGITCHAAIVAREMAKPCIIGTKIATEILKDGDLVEVNANKGIVRIIKN